MKTQLIAAAIAVAALCAPAFSHAAPLAAARITNEDLRQVVVSYADLNLGAATGQAALKARLRHAAQTVCGDEPDNRDPGAMRDYRACVSKTIGAAMAAVPAATMVAANGHNG
jgi:UrcA family protein